MSFFKCPSCKRMHWINDEYDTQDYVCVDSKLSELKQQEDLMPTDLYTRDNWNRNVYSTKTDEYKEVVVVDAELLPSMNKYTGKKEGTKNY